MAGSLDMTTFIKETQTLPKIPDHAVSQYRKQKEMLKNFVDNSMASHPDIQQLIGNNPFSMMYDNHTHHVNFMLTVFSLGNYELLAKTLPWVYRAYAAHQFQYAYFRHELDAWKAAIESRPDVPVFKEILVVYDWMIEFHDRIISLAESKLELESPIEQIWIEKKNQFLKAVLAGDHRQCLAITTEMVSEDKNLEQLYLHIIQPVMYEVGLLWERGQISVAQEHLASSIVGRVMAYIGSLDLGQKDSAPKIVITSAPNEFHEIGGWILSDVLEKNGWNVRYLGANTPAADLIEMLRDFRPKLLAISVTMAFNILKAGDIIRQVKEDADLKQIPIIIGGQAFNKNEKLWKQVGGDYFASDVSQFKQLVEKLKLDE